MIWLCVCCSKKLWRPSSSTSWHSLMHNSPLVRASSLCVDVKVQLLFGVSVSCCIQLINKFTGNHSFSPLLPEPCNMLAWLGDLFDFGMHDSFYGLCLCLCQQISYVSAISGMYFSSSLLSQYHSFQGCFCVCHLLRSASFWASYFIESLPSVFVCILWTCLDQICLLTVQLLRSLHVFVPGCTNSMKL